MMRVIVASLAALGFACADDGGNSVNGSTGRPDAAAPDAELSLPDAGLPDVGPPDALGMPDVGGGAPDARPGIDRIDPGPAKPVTLADVTEEPTPQLSWLRAVVTAGSDPYGFDFLRGSMTAPQPGEDDRGVSWFTTTFNPDGSVPLLRTEGVVVYLASSFELEEPQNLIFALDGFELNVDGRVLPSDPYRSGRHRHGVHLAAGRHELVARGDYTRGAPRIRFWESNTPVFFNGSDITRPDILSEREDQLYFGIHVANVSGEPLVGWEARVLESDAYYPSSIETAPIPAGASTQVAFLLYPKPGLAAGTTATVTLSLEGPAAEVGYAAEFGIPVVDGTSAYRRTFLSDMDGSAQYYGVVAPLDFDTGTEYALALSLHGAAVEAIGQARAYGAKDWMYIIAPTNRRPFGFDWQDWGRLDALESLADAQSTFRIDPEQIHITGHSMGGHGTWHIGVLHPDRFAVTGPSAGWPSYSTYGGLPQVPDAYARARAASETIEYKDNFADRPVYIVHGTADNNVPLSQAQLMISELESVTEDLSFHFEQGAGHWWDGYPEPGAACVDWPPMFETMRERRREEMPLNFAYTTPAPFVNDTFGFLRIRAAEDPYQDVSVNVTTEGSRTVVTTINARALELDGDALLSVGVTEAIVNGETLPVDGGPIIVGESIKGPGQHGPFKEVFFRPLCYIYPDDDDGARGLANNLVAEWAVIGNGRACALPFSRRDEAADMNRIYVGVESDMLTIPEAIPFEWTAERVEIDGRVSTADDTLLVFVYPDGERLNGVIFATEGGEWLARILGIFNGRSAFPDWFTWDFRRGENRIYYGRSGFFDPDFAYDPALER